MGWCATRHVAARILRVVIVNCTINVCKWYDALCVNGELEYVYVVCLTVCKR